MIIYKYYLIFIIIIILLLLFINKKSKIKKERTSFKLNGYHVIYSDARPKQKDNNVEYGTLLKSERYGINGKPDFIFEDMFKRKIIIVEIKSGLIKQSPFPHKGDLMQLAAYFAIAEEEYKQKIKFGRLMYKDYMFTIYNTNRLRKELLKTIKTMRLMLDGKKIYTESNYAKCRYCLCRATVCEFCKK